MSNLFFRVKKFSLEILIFILISIYIPFIGAIRSYAYYEQPILFGLLAERGWFAIGGCLFIYSILKKGLVSENNIKNIFLLFMLLSAFFYTIYYIGLEFLHLDPFEIAYFSDDRGYRMTVPKIFLVFGIYYTFSNFIISYDKRNIIYAAILLFLLVLFFKPRSLTLFIFASIFFILYLRGFINFKRKSFYALAASALTIILFIFLAYGNFWQSLVNLVIGESQDFSILSRFNQLLIVNNIFNEDILNLLFGVGRLSNQWLGGYEATFGHFYPSDMGIIGGIHLYGVFNVSIMVIFTLYFFSKIIKGLIKTQSSFQLALAIMLIHFLISTLSDGLYLGFDSILISYFIILGIRDRAIQNG